MTDVEWGTNELGTWTNSGADTTLSTAYTSWNNHYNSGIILSDIGSNDLTLECQFNAASSYAFIGVNPSSSNPEQPDNCYFCFYFLNQNQGVRMMVNEDWTLPVTSYTSTDVFKMVFNSSEVKFYMNGDLKRTVSTTATSGDFRIFGNGYKNNDRLTCTYSMGAPSTGGTLLPPPIAWVNV